VRVSVAGIANVSVNVHVGVVDLQSRQRFHA
jgi:hypothetical protein